jgi:ubiquinone/menaquinone biosynthesis C-methylase UbiE
MIKYLRNFFWFPFSSKTEIDKHQTTIRNIEWNSFKKYIHKGDTFLDLGCGAGYYLEKAEFELSCEVYGVDPAPGEHGVGRYSSNKKDRIIQGYAEDIKFQNNIFDIILCSHVLEHVENESASLNEMNRVLKEEGILIIGMPTATMSIISILSHYIFTTHVNILFFIKNIYKKEVFKRFVHIFVPASHSYPQHQFVTYDLNKYRVKKWRKLISKHFKIIEEIYPSLYPYPDYIQFFKPMKLKNFSSSIFFICTKK